MGFVEWFYENIGGKINVIFDYGVIIDEDGGMLSMALCQREGYFPVLTFKVKWGIRVEIHELDTSPEILQKVETVIQDVVKRSQMLYVPYKYKPMSFLSKLFCAIFIHPKVIVDYGTIYDHRNSERYKLSWGRCELSMALVHPYRQHPRLVFTWWGSRRESYYVDIGIFPTDNLYRIKAVIRDAYERLYEQKAT